MLESIKFLLLLDCIIKDDDDCLTSAKKPIKHKSEYDYEYMKKYTSIYSNMLRTCESEKRHCKNNSAYTKDLQRCCPVTCKTGALTEIECLALEECAFIQTKLSVTKKVKNYIRFLPVIIYWVSDLIII